MITLLESIVKTCGMHISKIKVYLDRHNYLSSYLGEEIWPILELLGVDNRKNHVHNINKTIVENLQNVYNKIDYLSNARRALITTMSSRKLTHRKQVYAIYDVLHISRRTF